MSDYRRGQECCPACNEPFESQPLQNERGDTVFVERCDRCGGVYFDWFDGEPADLAWLVPRAGAIHAPLAEDASCPKCQASFVREGAAFRCSGCTGLFLTADGLAALREEHVSQQGAASSTWLSRLANWLGWD